MAITNIMPINASVFQSCPFDLEVSGREDSEGFGITTHLLVFLLLPIWGTLGCGCLSFAISFWDGPLKPLTPSEEEFIAMS